MMSASVSLSNSIALEPNTVDNVADGEVKCQAKITAGTTIGLVWRATDTDNVYVALFGISGTFAGDVRWFKKSSGSFSQIGSTISGDFWLTSDATVSLMIRFVGSVAEFYINDTLVAIRSDSTFTTGRCGINADSGNTVQVDNFRVYAITTETQAAPGTGVRV